MPVCCLELIVQVPFSRRPKVPKPLLIPDTAMPRSSPLTCCPPRLSLTRSMWSMLLFSSRWTRLPYLDRLARMESAPMALIRSVFLNSQ